MRKIKSVYFNKILIFLNLKFVLFIFVIQNYICSTLWKKSHMPSETQTSNNSWKTYLIYYFMQSFYIEMMHKDIS